MNQYAVQRLRVAIADGQCLAWFQRPRGQKNADAYHWWVRKFNRARDAQLFVVRSR